MTQNARSNYEAVTGSKLNFFCIFLAFERITTNYRGTLVENVKKVINQPTLLYSKVTLNAEITFLLFKERGLFKFKKKYP
jgi:hypothetical protein